MGRIRDGFCHILTHTHLENQYSYPYPYPLGIIKSYPYPYPPGIAGIAGFIRVYIDKKMLPILYPYSTKEGNTLHSY